MNLVQTSAQTDEISSTFLRPPSYDCHHLLKGKQPDALVQEKLQRPKLFRLGLLSVGTPAQILSC